MNVLLADDERTIAITLRDELTDAGHDVTVANDGNEAAELLGKQRFEVLITDIRMPGLDGIELLRAAFYRFESFALDNVARELLGEGKLLHGSGRGEEITELFQQDKTRLAAYNLKDCELVSDIFEHTTHPSNPARPSLPVTK